MGMYILAYRLNPFGILDGSLWPGLGNGFESRAMGRDLVGYFMCDYEYELVFTRVRIFLFLFYFKSTFLFIFIDAILM